MGLPTSDETDVPGKPGARMTIFEHGRIYWSAATGPYAVIGGILNKYLALGGPAFAGLPTTDEYDMVGGRDSGFEGGRISWSLATGPYRVCGAIMAKYDLMGGAAGMGFPLNDEMNAPGVSGGRMSEFSRGRVYWSPTAGSNAVYGAILTKYKAVGASQTYGLPVADEKDVSGRPGAREGQFERGRIYWSPATGSSQVYGAILARYLLGGGPAGSLGLPVSDEYGVPGGRRTNFQGGYIVWNYFGGGTSVVTTH